MEKHYTDEKNAQIVIALLKKHGVNQVIASPGTTNIPIVGSVQNDPFFTVYSSVDERSAAYMACGLARESGKPVVLTCTGATASRNYLPGLTEAYYSKIPVIALTSLNDLQDVGNLKPQNIDRSQLPNDVMKLSVNLPIVNSSQDYWFVNHQVNRALLEMTRHEGGPVHINLNTNYMATFTTKQLPKVNFVERFFSHSQNLPQIPVNSKVGIFIGRHKKFTKEEELLLDKFCEQYNGAVFGDRTAGYNGKYLLNSSLGGVNLTRKHANFSNYAPTMTIHLGEVTGDYSSMDTFNKSNGPVWRVSEDGELRDTFKRLRYVFEMNENAFFSKYIKEDYESKDISFFETWNQYISSLRNSIPELPFANSWIAQNTIPKIPKNSFVNLGILNSLRNWNFYPIDSSIQVESNVGGFGIDGLISTTLGASLVNENKLYFVVLGDLAFFYDVNSLGNRHLGKNLRILLINNGTGTEFRNSSHIGSQFGEQSDQFIAAGGHFRQKFNLNDKKSSLAQAWSTTIGFNYYSASSKDEYLNILPKFMDSSSDAPVILEVFTNPEDESDSLEKMVGLDKEYSLKGKAYNYSERILPKESLKKIRRSLKR
ncbi:2-succinyl-5-enolpyruvyl-6-hydroxy-3-cyclohexene-1-carboxylate synthase [Enterococcus raffinosus]|uniref:thiamine pyrophosphate-binding protein n=1 Tax=Enterococcus raffinosus TaxID=71452 RepID=UPI001C102E1F|nr:2-succinyl-5-enolpyruvyl-6-hydroxy-3-cyclohexene-1-carboxylate synthase [Enterococcus raffinosus]